MVKSVILDTVDLDEEVMEIYPGSEFQLCTIHYTRGLKSNVREKDIDEITIDALAVFSVYFLYESHEKSKPLK